MGFSQNLKNKMVDEWKDFYINYDKLIALIKKIQNQEAPKDAFTKLINDELSKINKFYFLLEAKAADEKNKIFSTYNGLVKDNPNATFDDKNTNKISTENRLASLDDWDVLNKGDSDSFLNPTKIPGINSFSKIHNSRKKEKHFIEFLNSLINIKLYRDLNVQGFIKLGQFYADKCVEKGHQHKIFLEQYTINLKKFYFYKSRRISTIKRAIKKVYITLFDKNETGRTKTIMKRLIDGHKPNDLLFLLSGVFVGCSISFTAIYNYINDDVRFFNAMNNLFMGFIFFGFCFLVFQASNINYKFIFSFDIASSLDISSYFLLSSIFLLANNLIFFGHILFSDSVSQKNWNLSSGAIILLLGILFLVNPFSVCFPASRDYLVTTLVRALFSPISTVRFRQFYFIDLLQSFKFSIVEIMSAYFDDKSKWMPVLFFSFLPAIRILQCLKRFSTSRLVFPHLYNCFKYLLALSTLFLEAIKNHPAFENLDDSNRESLNSIAFTFNCLSALASFSWDILVDWSLSRSRFVYGKKFYVFAIIFNILVRMSGFFAKFVKDNYFPKIDAIIFPICEVARRFVWTLIRVEVEHMNNCDNLKIHKKVELTTGEFFYKKDHDEKAADPLGETETEIDEEFINRKTLMETSTEESAMNQSINNSFWIDKIVEDAGDGSTPINMENPVLKIDYDSKTYDRFLEENGNLNNHNDPTNVKQSPGLSNKETAHKNRDNSIDLILDSDMLDQEDLISNDFDSESS